jgi:hypothetical protein
MGVSIILGVSIMITCGLSLLFVYCIRKNNKNAKDRNVEKFVEKKISHSVPFDPIFTLGVNNTRASLDCCPSVYSTDRGCVCMTNQQKELLAKRGLNRGGKIGGDGEQLYDEI